jgi:WbqC-like protein family
MGKKLAAVQSSYIPWKGYFDLIHAVDEFVLFDDAQYTRRDWRNRNRIKTCDGPLWLTIPVAAKGNYLSPIRTITVSERGWAEHHWKALVNAYARAPHFRTYEAMLGALYREAERERLSDINRMFIEAICRALGIDTKLRWSMDYPLAEGKTERLIGLCEQAGADHYISGPSARAYIDEGMFRRAGITLEFFDYAGYREYEQVHPPFDHYVSVLDLLVNVGPDARKYMLTF